LRSAAWAAAGNDRVSSSVIPGAYDTITPFAYRSDTSLHLAQHGQEWLAAPFSEDEFRETVRTTYERVVKDPDAIVSDLTGRLNRALGGSAPIPH
jgi:hypothetical protein